MAAAVRREKPARIINSAAQLFDLHGFHETSMDMIAAHAEVAKPTLYYYFSGKDQILWAIHDDLIGELISAHEQRLSSGAGPNDLLAGIVSDLLNFCVTKPGHVRVYLDHYRSLPQPFRSEAKKRRQAFERNMEDVLMAGIEQGIFRKVDVRVASLAIFGACRTFNWAHDWGRDESEVPARSIANVINDLFLHGLERDGGGS